MDPQTYKIQAQKLDEAFLDNLNRTLANIQSDSIERRTLLKQSVALLFLLTWCESSPLQGEEVGQDAELRSCHQAILDAFESITRRESGYDNPTRPILRSCVTPTDEERSSRLNFLWELPNSVFVEVPETYSRDVTSAFLYLLLTDASSSFSAQPASQKLVEIPCLREMIRHSSLNNIKKLDALLGEYLALVRVCLCDEFSQFSLYQTKTVGYDFALKSINDEQYLVSVKSVHFSEVTCFQSPKEVTDCPEEISLRSGKNEINILLHDCQCTFYQSHPLHKVEVRSIHMKRQITGLQCADCKGSCKKLFKKKLKRLQHGVVYLASAKLFFELRYAFCTFDQCKFRGAPFKLRDRVCKHLCGTGSHENGSDRWLQTAMVKTDSGIHGHAKINPTQSTE